jgi:hypothetical protein
MSGLGEAAVGYAKRGWFVFPLAARGKTPVTKRGMLDASTDVGIVEAWWEQRPQANIGVACGPSGLLVVDLDGEEPAARTWANLAAHHGGHAKTLVARTGKGFHLYFAGQGRSTVSRIAPLVDTRGAGGYVIAPPSVHGSGAVYRWFEPERRTRACAQVAAGAPGARAPSRGRRRAQGASRRCPVHAVRACGAGADQRRDGRDGRGRAERDAERARLPLRTPECRGPAG